MNPTLSSPHAVAVAKTSSQAIWSLVLGILSITCLWILGSIPAIILGILAIKNIDRSGGALKGRGMAIAGLVTGCVGIISGIFQFGILASMSMPAYNQIQARANQAQEMNQIKQITIACHYYATEKNGAFPKTLTTLVEEGYLDAATVLEPKSAIGRSFLYRPGLTGTSPDDEPLLASPVPIGGKRVVGQVDGFVKPVAEEDFQADYAHLFPRG